MFLKLYKSIIFVLLFIAAGEIQAQAPNKFSYQAVIRNQANALVVNRQVGLRFTIIQGSSSGIIVFSEKHTTTTNQNGMVSVEIGAGHPYLIALPI